MQTRIKHNLDFIIPLILLWAVLAIAILTYDKAILHLMLNSYHTPALDVFFRYFTEVGGWLPFVVAAGLLFYKYGAALLVFASQLIVTIPVQIIKRTVDADRPKLFFEKLQLAFPHVEGVHLHGTHSFPSGHTASAFALFFCLSLLVKNPIYKLLFFVLALAVGYSRIYLSQHFALDVLVGSIIGILFTYIYIMYHQKIKVGWFDKRIELIK